MITLGCAFQLTLAVVLVSGGYLFGPRFGYAPIPGAVAGGLVYLLVRIVELLLRTVVEKVVRDRDGGHRR